MKCQSLFSDEKNKQTKYFKMSSAEIFSQHAKHQERYVTVAKSPFNKEHRKYRNQLILYIPLSTKSTCNHYIFSNYYTTNAWHAG